MPTPMIFLKSYIKIIYRDFYLKFTDNKMEIDTLKICLAMKKNYSYSHTSRKLT